ncbi:MAG: SpoIIE family protein phosphatase [Bryobacterales bacterium]|nr:SpoIIE family protein phosphatase [Bryobacterales bacterium]
MDASLTVINPSGQRTSPPIAADPFLIGRQPDNHLVLRDNRVSRLHARILRDGPDYLVEDLRSRSGVFVNGTRIAAPTRLHNADVVTFGFDDGYQLVFQKNDEPTLGHLAERVNGAAAPAAPNHLGRLRALVEVARSLQSSLSLHEVLESIVDAALAITRTERGFLLLRRANGNLEIEVARDAAGAPLKASELRVPTRLIARALDRRRELLSMHFDPFVADAEVPDQSVAALDLRSVVCVPLVRVRSGAALHETMATSPSDTAGLLYLDSRLDLADLSAGNRELLQTLAIEASTILENARLLEEERERRRLEAELHIARTLQQDLLPAKLPGAGWFRMAGSSVPSQHVGGDYFDAAPAGPDWWTMVVADVSGKGIGSALLASLLQGAFLHAPTDAAGIRTMLERINTYLYERTEGEKYATVFYAALHRSGRMLWTNAGHCPPILLGPHGTGAEITFTPLAATSMPLGMLDIAQFSVRETQLEPGPRIVVYSDGYTDAQNPAGESFDQQRLHDLMRESAAGYGAERMHAALSAALRRFVAGAVQRDDMTLVIAEYHRASH